MLILIVFINDSERRIPVQYAKRVVGRKMYGGQNSNIPLKVNTSGVIPVIFASSIMQTPLIIASFVGTSETGKWAEFSKYLNSQYWFSPGQWKYSIGLVVYMFWKI